VLFCLLHLCISSLERLNHLRDLVGECANQPLKTSRHYSRSRGAPLCWNQIQSHLRINRRISELVAFGSPVLNFPLEFSALPFPVLQVAHVPMHFAKQAAIKNRATAVMTQARVLVAQLVLALS
jgi:hypothetical protein